jgi:hypothetical protein
MAGLYILTSLIFLVAERVKIRRQHASATLHDGEIQTLIRQMSQEYGSDGKMPDLSLVGAAALLGLLIGRRPSK